MSHYLCLEPQLLKDTCMFLHQELAFLIPNHTFRTFHLLVEVLLLSQEKFQHFLLLLQPNSLRRTFQFYLPFRILLEIRYGNKTDAPLLEHDFCVKSHLQIISADTT